MKNIKKNVSIGTLEKILSEIETQNNFSVACHLHIFGMNIWLNRLTNRRWKVQFYLFIQRIHQKRRLAVEKVQSCDKSDQKLFLWWDLLFWIIFQKFQSVFIRNLSFFSKMYSEKVNALPFNQVGYLFSN